MKLHNDHNLFRQAIQFTADQMGLTAIYVEKDYWVTLALSLIANNEDIGGDVVFKGGTALSKCYYIIERFSEDIDLVVLRREGETDSRMKSKLKAISKVLENELPEVNIDEITHKKGMNRKTAHAYGKVFDGNYGQVRDVIILESTWLGYYEPYSVRSIISFVGNMMIENSQQEMVDEYELMPFNLPVLKPERTICEKIMSLVRFSYGENPVNDLRQKIRHVYDLHQLLKVEDYSNFLDSPAFDQMLLRVANDDVLSFRNNNQWLRFHPGQSLIFSDPQSVWSELQSVYHGNFRNLVYGDFPEGVEIQRTLIQIKTRLERVEWNVHF